MRGVFDDEEVRLAQVKQDTELTLGSGMLLAIFFGLVLLCGLCFGLGYTVGHRGTPPPLAPTTQSPASAPSAGAGNSNKPAATAEPVQASSTQPADTTQPPATPAEAQSAPAQAAAAAGQSVSPVVGAGPRPALTPVSAAQGAGPQVGGPMVQIAAISNVEDADVLTAALRKRGYVVTTRRDPVDNLIHVRIGPFASLAEANTWKQKLLSDGYNAIVQP